MKKDKLAAALKYEHTDNAPTVVAKGKNHVAEKIIAEARKNKIPIKVDAECAELINLTELGHEIPEELYGVVAKILVFVNTIDKIHN